MELPPIPPVDWQTPAGRLLDRLASALPAAPVQTVVVFGSAVLQVLLDGDFLSQDVDLIAGETVAACAISLAEKDRGLDLVLQVCDPLTFRTAQGWEQRAWTEVRHGHRFIFPHPWDILVSKLGRLEAKDLEAFHLVIARTGRPTAEELTHHLRLAVDLYRPQFDEEKGSDYLAQTQNLWQELFGASIDVRREIIQPAIERRRRQYAADDGEPDLKNRLREL